MSTRPENTTANLNAKFVEGSTMRHVVTMAATGSIGLIAVFLVDSLNLFYISLLGQQELAAAVGYASTILFFHTSIGIGLSIAATALTSRALGAGKREQARQLAGLSLMVVGGVSIVLTTLTYPILSMSLEVLGAKAETARLAERFCALVLPSVPMLSLGMTISALLRSCGDAKRAMYVTLGAAIAIALLDPLMIFVFKLGLDGAAFANVIARCVMLAIGFHGLLKVHQFYATPARSLWQSSLWPFFAIGIPAILTQVATPVGNAAVTSAVAQYGDHAVAGWAVIGRLTPLAFAAVFALSGSIGAILGQNLGAKRYDRLHSTVRDSLFVTTVYVLCVWALLALSRNLIADLFGAQGDGHDIIVFFCLVVAGTFVFNGFLFVANATFNNLGYPLYSTMLNWGRSTIGVFPFVWLGGKWYGVLGVVAGFGLGVVFFGLASICLCFRVLRKLERDEIASQKRQSP